MIVVVDYHICNVGSVVNMLKKVGVPAKASDKKEDILAADKLILPGVGSFDTAINKLRELDLVGLLNQQALEAKKPILGICLGMQLLSEGSEEGTLPGLGWISGRVKRFNFANEKPLKIPHMGWNYIKPKPEIPLFKGLEEKAKFYFVHSYHFDSGESDSICKTEYGFNFTSAVAKGNILGTQFHPEKSRKFGVQLLTNFAENY